MSNGFAKTAIVVANEGLGEGDPELVKRVAATYFRTLFESEQIPSSILLYTAGVKLACTGSPCIEELRALENAGVEIISCRTCLEHYGLSELIEVGQIGNMLRIVEAQALAEKLVRI